ncbi:MULTISPECIES: thiol:disulfide interchange protein DsbA/DsbL [Pseudoalteromonas]|uniref:Thiol:disulfide interchange protein n=2 Tax=Pseudoalteromonas TaxID=53246 RepID=V4H326_PSEL2|nr:MULTISPECIES: thiol:disulfide interchange protein DsbA/DsbL [Pseudoalteromonas]ESP91821.1 protein-disulfide isomerase [Pseudoalteromonas luteoviolacea 2ta16]KZN42931.1 disulfide bond formation protein [Pseudoalteromonas luteoviolacea NCIMB 1944]MBQ4839567.1 thiol:disulfide interchange protein DsbA/DsbL [Pseudoalteromonas luteoviolacea]MCG7549107.1 thiol:disulfide interchange protein DsbA/DsbL [Pseudoalteromonas sp. Of7M-16]MDK2596994.1 thiol:disulfide interchange protein DsbA/DsbL [Pseudoal
MLKSIKAALLALMLPLAANAMTFEAGKHYEVIAERGTKKPEVTEYFSFYCPACNNFEGLIDQFKPKLDSGVKFKKSHVDFVGVRDPEHQKMIATALATAEVLPQKKQIVSAIFSHIHTKRGKFNELADIKDVFVAQGVDGAKFDKMYKSFSVRTKASKMARQQKQLQDKGALSSVPTFIVNGKYKLVLGRSSGITSPDDIAKLINYLASK